MSKPYIIGIAGGSASGKSTFAAQLVQCLEARGVSCLCLSTDAYFLPEDQRPRATSPVSGKRYRDDNHPEAFDLARLVQDVQQTVRQATVAVIVVEGLLALYDESIREQLERKLYIDCPADVRVTRRIQRNLTWGLSLEDIVNVYVDLVRYRHEEFVEPTRQYADRVIDGLGDWGGALAEEIRRIPCLAI